MGDLPSPTIPFTLFLVETTIWVVRVIGSRRVDDIEIGFGIGIEIEDLRLGLRS